MSDAQPAGTDAGRRIVVFGGGGFFGTALIDRLLADDLGPVAAVARRPLPPRPGVEALIGDAESAADTARLLRAGDIVMDTIGPYYRRTTTLLQAALAAGADYLDLNDSPLYAERALAFDGQARAAGLRLLTSCSSISVVPVVFAALCGVARPRRITMLLAPETRRIVSPGSAETLLAALRQHVALREGGCVVPTAGWSRSRRAWLPARRGGGRYYLFNSADYIHIPRVFPDLETLEFLVCSGVPLLDRALALLRRLPEDELAYRLLTAPRLVRSMLPLIRALGRSGGAIGAEIEDERGDLTRIAVTTDRGGFLVPLAPALLATGRLLAGAIPETGVVPHDRQIDPRAFARYLAALGFTFRSSRPLHLG